MRLTHVSCRDRMVGEGTGQRSRSRARRRDPADGELRAAGAKLSRLRGRPSISRRLVHHCVRACLLRGGLTSRLVQTHAQRACGCRTSRAVGRAQCGYLLEAARCLPAPLTAAAHRRPRQACALIPCLMWSQDPAEARTRARQDRPGGLQLVAQLRVSWAAATAAAGALLQQLPRVPRRHGAAPGVVGVQWGRRSADMSLGASDQHSARPGWRVQSSLLTGARGCTSTRLP